MSNTTVLQLFLVLPERPNIIGVTSLAGCLAGLAMLPVGQFAGTSAPLRFARLDGLLCSDRRAPFEPICFFDTGRNERGFYSDILGPASVDDVQSFVRGPGTQRAARHTSRVIGGLRVSGFKGATSPRSKTHTSGPRPPTETVSCSRAHRLRCCCSGRHLLPAKPR